MTAHCESLAGNGLPITNPLHQAVTNDRVLMLACTHTQVCKACNLCCPSSRVLSGSRRSDCMCFHACAVLSALTEATTATLEARAELSLDTSAHVGTLSCRHHAYYVGAERENN